MKSHAVKIGGCMKILVVEDDEATACAVTEALTYHHYSVNEVRDGETGLQLAQTFEFDLIVLDIGLPTLDGIHICRQLRQMGYQTPILLVSGKDSNGDRLRGFDAGADDYLVKPFELSEFIARIRALLRRGKITQPNVLTWEALQLDLSVAEVTYQGKELHLTPKEYGLLELFLRNPRRIYSRSALLDHIWSQGEFPAEEAVTTQIKGLRQKLKAGGMKIDPIETVYGLGYRLKSAPEPEKTDSESQMPENPELVEKVRVKIAAIWERFKPDLNEMVRLFEQEIAQFASGTLDPQLRQQAIAHAHRAIGSLGTFGFLEGSKIAREIEELLNNPTASGYSAAQKLKELVGSLTTAVAKPPHTTPSTPRYEVPSVRILVIDDDSILTERLKIEAKVWGWHVDIAHSLKDGRTAIAVRSPDLILLDLCFPNTDENGLSLLAELNQRKPPIPVLVFSAHNQLSDRLKVARLGSRTFLPKPLPADEIFTAVSRILHQNHTLEGKVMVVDDDPQILDRLRTLLQPWGFQIATLDDPERFWDVLETATPDLLILDVEMPGYNGLELCEVVRNDWRWNHLPILILSAHTDTQTVQQVFTVGADDYVSKPIVEPEIVARIYNRLERTQMRRKLANLNVNPSPKARPYPF